MSCSICDDKGFIKEVCPECEGSPDEIGSTGCSTCEGNGYIETPCKECNEDGNNDDDDDNNGADTDFEGICPECGRKTEFVSIEDSEIDGFSLVNWFCKYCDAYNLIEEPTDGLSDGAVEEALGGRPPKRNW